MSKTDQVNCSQYREDQLNRIWSRQADSRVDRTRWSLVRRTVRKRAGPSQTRPREDQTGRPAENPGTWSQAALTLLAVKEVTYF